MRNLAQYLRLFRFPLVFTAIGDAWAVRMLGRDVAGAWGLPPAGELALLAGVSVGLYSLGMVLNDVMDSEIDRRLHPGKPIPSGDVKRSLAAGIAVAMAVAAGLLAAWAGPGTLAVAFVAAVLIVGYDTGLKRLAVVGIVLLGLIRAVHCQISTVGLAGPEAGVGPALAGWVSIFLFTHVAVVSLVAYEWEGKRPIITPTGRWLLAFAIVIIDVLAVGYLTGREPDAPVAARLTFPLLAGLGYMLLLVRVLAGMRLRTPAEGGRLAMRLGLIWLLVYDAAFLASAGRWAGVVAMGVLLGLLLLSSRGLLALSRRAGLAETSR